MIGLREIFEKQDLQRLNSVLNEGLLAAEQDRYTEWSASEELRNQFVSRGQKEPDWLDKVNPELANFYRDWVTQNTKRINAVLGKKNRPKLERW